SQLNIPPSVERAQKSVRNALSSPGVSLDAGTRGFFESRFGRDLSGVRIHTDASAAESADAVNASAYAVGPHVVFSKGSYEPNSEKGRRLLAHELAHVVQPKVSTVLRRKLKDELARGGVRPLVQKFLEGKATEAEKVTLKKILLNQELTEAEITVLQNHVESDFKAALEKQIKGQVQSGGQIQ